MKNDKRHITEGVELSNQVVIWTFGEKETYKYLGILEPDTIKQQEMKGKLKKSISEEPESYSKQNSMCCPPRKVFSTILEGNQRRT